MPEAPRYEGPRRRASTLTIIHSLPQGWRKEAGEPCVPGGTAWGRCPVVRGLEWWGQRGWAVSLLLHVACAGDTAVQALKIPTLYYTLGVSRSRIRYFLSALFGTERRAPSLPRQPAPPARTCSSARARACSLLALLPSLCSGSPRHLRPPQQPRPSARGRVCRLEAAHRALARAADAPHASPSARAAHHREAHHAADCAKAPLSHHHTAASLSRPRFPRTGSRDALIARQSAAANGAAAPPRAPAIDPAAAISAS